MHVLLGPLRTRPQPAGLGTPGAGGTRPWDASGSCLPPPPLLPRWPWLPGDNRHRPDRLTLASPDLDPSGRNYRGWQTEEECGRGLKSRWVTDPRHKRSPVRRRPWRPAWQPPPPKGSEAGPAALSSTKGHASEAEVRAGGPTRGLSSCPPRRQRGRWGRTCL